MGSDETCDDIGKGRDRDCDDEGGMRKGWRTEKSRYAPEMIALNSSNGRGLGLASRFTAPVFLVRQDTWGSRLMRRRVAETCGIDPQWPGKFSQMLSFSLRDCAGSSQRERKGKGSYCWRSPIEKLLQNFKPLAVGSKDVVVTPGKPSTRR